MPGRNGRGPRGQGPRTGRGLGWCRATDVRQEQPQPIFAPGGGAGCGPGWGGGCGAGFGPGRGWGRGRGAGWRNRFGWTEAPPAGWGWGPGPVGAPLDQEEELTALRQQARNLEAQLEELQTRIRELAPEPAATQEQP